MRVTESRMLEMVTTAVATARDRAAQAQGVLSSGNRVSKPSDDPAAWAEGQRAAIQKSMSEGRGQAMGLAIDGLQATSSTLASVNSALDQLGAMAVQGANGTLDATSRADAAFQVRALRDAALQALNQKSPDGTYTLSGSKGTSAPFDASGAYVGDDTARTVSTGEGQSAPGTVTGADLTTANGGVDVLKTFNDLATALDNNDVPTIQTLLPTINTAVGQVAKMRAVVGERLSALQSADDARQSFELSLTARHESAVEADPVAAASDLTRTATSLEAARTSAQQIVQLLQLR